MEGHSICILPYLAVGIEALLAQLVSVLAQTVIRGLLYYDTLRYQ